MKIGIDMGHNAPPDTGASGIKQEDVLTKEVGVRLINKLESAGHTVIDCTPTSATSVNHSLQQRIDKANAANVSIFVSIHFNAFNGNAYGTEIFAISNAAKGIATPVLNEIVKLGFFNRGVKERRFFVLRKTNMPAILVECCFCDSSRDMNLYNADKMAAAIATGLIGQSPTTTTLTLTVTEETVLKPSTEQSSDLPSESLVKISPGDYPILDWSFEEGHYWIEWIDSSKGNRKEHFIFAGHSKIN